MHIFRPFEEAERMKAKREGRETGWVCLGVHLHQLPKASSLQLTWFLRDQVYTIICRALTQTSTVHRCTTLIAWLPNTELHMHSNQQKNHFHAGMTISAVREQPSQTDRRIWQVKVYIHTIHNTTQQNTRSIQTCHHSCSTLCRTHDTPATSSSANSRKVLKLGSRKSIGSNLVSFPCAVKYHLLAQCLSRRTL
jgi:hypothetical protein